MGSFFIWDSILVQTLVDLEVRSMHYELLVILPLVQLRPLLSVYFGGSRVIGEKLLQLLGYRMELVKIRWSRAK